ncbi:MAG: FecR domain-containing protein [Prevotella sp.]|nr:FecR domain-containing protein [Prevotella sp.]
MEQTDNIIEKAIDIVDAGTELTEEQLHDMRQDNHLMEDVKDILNVKTAMRMSDVDVEERLQQFHERMNKEIPMKKSFLSARIIYKVMLAAAVFIGLLMVLNIWKGKDQSIEKQLAENVVFTADDMQDGISLTNEKGEQIALSPDTKQNSAITLDDFRNIFADKKNIESVTLNVPYGKSAAVTLPDGSTAYLHPGSKVIFPTAFVGKERVVMLEGRAYFKVAKDAEHPFIVMAGDAQTTVLGTEFDINTNSGEITLINGSIKVNIEEMNKSIVLTPRQQVRYDIKSSAFDVSEVDVVPYEYWRDGYLYFDNVELKEIMEAIGKNFNMTVEFRNHDALHYKMRFITERNNGVEAAIEMMNNMRKAHVSIRGNKIVVE